MIKLLSNEEWKPLQLTGSKMNRRKYALSSHGRIASYTNKLEEDGKLISGSATTGYKTLNFHYGVRKGTFYIHRELAKLFIKKPSRRHEYVIHLNHCKTDNSLKNLAWATRDEMMAHQQNSPTKIAYQKLRADHARGLKLNTTKVRGIKKILANENRKLTIKQLAEKYDVSVMAIYRIKSGENWGNV